MVNLGDKVKDKLTDLRGIVWAKAHYLYGCTWICVVPKELYEGKPLETVWMDEDRLEVLITKPKRKSKLPSFGKGGPGPSIPIRSVPNPGRSD